MRFIASPLLFSVQKTLLVGNVPKILAFRHSSHMSWFKESLSRAKNIVIITGEDISNESGLTPYGLEDQWRRYPVSSLATSDAFLTFPSLIWEFYHHRREIAAKAEPNEAHKAIARFQEKHGAHKSITVITQSIDGLHSRAGTKNLIQLNGSLFKTRCIKCNDVLPNNDSPICEALSNKGSPDVTDTNSDIPEELLPHCSKSSCSGLLRPDIIWYGQPMEPSVIKKAEDAISKCEICIVVGNASRMFPTAIFASDAIEGGAITAELNEESTNNIKFYCCFHGPYGKTLTDVLESRPID